MGVMAMIWWGQWIMWLIVLLIIYYVKTRDDSVKPNQQNKAKP